MVINNIKFSPTLDYSLVSSPSTYVAVMFLVKKNTANLPLLLHWNQF